VPRPTLTPLAGLLLSAALLPLLGPGCAGPGDEEPDPASAAQDPTAAALAHRRWSERIGQGGGPRGEADFRWLAARGYRTVISVDGAPTDVDGAARHGLRYAHVPIGYDGIERAEALAIVKAAGEAEGPVYVHCHHGKHRGPAAAALARIAVEGVPAAAAVEGLLETLSPVYPGLRRDVEEFEAPTPEELTKTPAPAPRVRPADLVELMIEAEVRHGHLKVLRAAGWKADAEHPDLVTRVEARLLTEAFVETSRLDQVQALGEAFRSELDLATEAARELEEALVATEPARVEAAWSAIGRSCTSCHAAFRN
jgi:protein tyrosine phosphatase (PTP) superfamily phosphohydrolase (DUF442 family)